MKKSGTGGAFSLWAFSSGTSESGDFKEEKPGRGSG